MDSLLPKLRRGFQRKPSFYGLIVGPAVFWLPLVVTDLVWTALTGENNPLLNSNPSLYLSMLLVRALVGGMLFGPLTAKLWASWLARDLEGLWRSTWGTGCVLYLVTVTRAISIAAHWSGRKIMVFDAYPLVQKGCWLVLALATNVPFVWSCALVLIGWLLERRLRYEIQRERQFEPPLP